MCSDEAPLVIHTEPGVEITTEQNSRPANASSLRVAVSKKAVFVSGLDPQTSVEEVIDHIKIEVDVSNIFGFHVHKLNIDPNRGYSSFKIFTGRSEEAYKKLMDSSFWPEGVYADYFRSRSKRSAQSN